MLLKKKQASCCSGASCCGWTADPAADLSLQKADGTAVGELAAARSPRQMVIDFLYLDLEVCQRCQGTDEVLDEAVAEVSQILRSAGFEVVQNKVNVNTEELAVRHRFVSSPTIRINGQDIDAEVKESLCESCGDLCGDSVDCRVWTFQGVEYNQPPKAMIINAILSAAYGPAAAASEQVDKPYILPDNLKKFYQATKKKVGV